MRYMAPKFSEERLFSLLKELRSLPKETEWAEFKKDNADPNEIGEYISALSNSAALCGKTNAYLVWGIADSSHDIIGTAVIGISPIWEQFYSPEVFRILRI